MAMQFAFGKIVTDGLVLAVDPADTNSYPGSSTAWRDISGNNNTGTLTNGPIFDSGSIKSIFFDGTNDYVDFGNGSSLNMTNNVSFDMWFKLGSNYGVVGSNWGGLISKRFLGSSFTTLGINFNVTSNILQMFYNTSGTFRIISVSLTSNFNSEVWTYIAGTYAQNTTNTNMVLYKNGISLTSGTTADNITTSPANLLVASGYQGADYTNMNCGPVRIYNRALSSSEIIQNYNAQKSRFNL